MSRIQRRSFLALLGSSLVTAAGVASARPALAPASRTVLVQRSPVAGLYYHHGPVLWPRLATGDALALVREPDNPHDRQAVRVDWHGWKLGYIPRVQNTAVAQMLDRGESLHARIDELVVEGEDIDGYEPWKRIMIEVYLD